MVSRSFWRGVAISSGLVLVDLKRWGFLMSGASIQRRNGLFHQQSSCRCPRRKQFWNRTRGKIGQSALVAMLKAESTVQTKAIILTMGDFQLWMLSQLNVHTEKILHVLSFSKEDMRHQAQCWDNDQTPITKWGHKVLEPWDLNLVTYFEVVAQ